MVSIAGCDRDDAQPAERTARTARTPQRTQPTQLTQNCSQLLADSPALTAQQRNLGWRRPQERWPLCSDVSAKLAAKPAPLAPTDQAQLWTFLDLSQGMAGFSAEGSIELLFSAAREQSKGFGGICGFKDRPIPCRTWAAYGQHRGDFVADGKSADLAGAIRNARAQTPEGSVPTGAIIVTEGISDQRTDEQGRATRVTPDVASADVAVELAQAVSEERGIWLALASAPFSGKVYLGATPKDLPPGSKCREFIERQPWYAQAVQLTGKAIKIDCDGEMALGGYHGPRTLMVLGVSSPRHHREIEPMFHNVVRDFQHRAKELFARRNSTVELGRSLEPTQLAPRTHEVKWSTVAESVLVAQKVRDHSPKISKPRAPDVFTAACGQSGLLRWTLGLPAGAESQLPPSYASELHVLLHDVAGPRGGQSLRSIVQADKKGVQVPVLGAKFGQRGMDATLNCDLAVGHRAKVVDDEGRIPLRALAVARLVANASGQGSAEKDVIAGLPPGLRSALEPAAGATSTIEDLNSNALIAAPWQIPALRRFVVGLQQAVDKAGFARLQEQSEGTRGCIAGCSQLMLVLPERIEHEDQLDDGCAAGAGARRPVGWLAVAGAWVVLLVWARRRNRQGGRGVA